MPGRFRVPLLRQVDPEHAGGFGGHELHPRRLPDIVGHGPGQEIGDVHVALLERGGPRGLLGHAAEDESLDRGRLPPVALEGLHDQLDARREAHHLVGPGADRGLLEAVVADPVHVLLRHDPRGAGGRGAVEGHEVRPRLLEVNADAPGVDDLDFAHPVLEQLGRRALVAVERELHVLRRDGIAVVERDALAEDELVAEPVPGHAPRLGEARRIGPGRHGLHQRVVNGVVHHERRDQSLGLRGVQPAGGQGDVHGVRQGPLGHGRRRGGAAEEQQQGQGSQRHGAEPESGHAILLVAAGDPALAGRRRSVFVLSGGSPI